MSEITLYGHRGGGDPYPDSTVESYSWGANWGADSLEPDLYLTKDGVLVVSHDNIAGGFANVTYAEALALNPDLLTFAQVIELVKQFSIESGRDIGIVPELKDQSYAAAEALVRTLVDADFTDRERVVVQSFGSQNLQWLSDVLMPAAGVDFQLALLTSGISNLSVVATYADIIAPSVGSFTAADVQAAHDAGLKVVAWTIAGSQSSIQSLLDMGVDGVFVDNMELARPGEAAVEGRNVIYGAPQWDVVTDTAGDDEVYAMRGDDIIRASAGGNDVLYGDGGNDLIFGGEGDDKLTGGSGADYLDGGSGADVLDGSTGNDVVMASGDEVLFRAGDGIDLVVTDGASKITFTGIRSTDVTVILDGASMIIRAGEDALVIRDGHDATHLPGTIVFADGIVWSADDLAAHAVTGTDAAVEAVLPDLEYVLDRAPRLAVASMVAIGTDLVADDGLGNGKLTDTVENVEFGATYRLGFSLADLGGTEGDGVKVLWNGEVVYEGIPDGTGGAMHVIVAGGSGDGSNQLVFEGTGAEPGLLDVALTGVTLVKLADPGVPVAQNAAPLAQSVSLEISQDLLHTGSVVAMDADGDPLVYSLGDSPAHGTLAFNADGTYSYAPGAGYTGQDAFTYVVNDGHGGVTEASIALTIKPGVLVGADLIVNGSFEDTSQSTGNNGSGDWGYRNAGNPIVGWTELNGQRIEQHWDTTNGVSARDGSIWVDMNGYQNNTAIVQTIAHVEAGATYQLSFALADVDAVAGVSDGIKVLWGGQVVWSGVAPSSGWETVVLRVAGGAGDGSNRLEFIGAQSNAPATTYGAALDDVHFVKLANAGEALPDAAPDARDGHTEGSENQPVIGRLVATDPDGDAPLIFSLEDGPSHGSITVDADGTFTYTPVTGFSGTDAFTFKVDDGHGGWDVATQTLTIEAGVVVYPNLIVNGGFEDLTGADNAASWGYRNTSPAGVIEGWVNTSDTRAEVHKDTVGGISSKAGAYWFDMEGAPANATLVQTVAGVEEGATYQLKFSIADTDAAQTNDSIRVSWGGQVIYEGTPKNSWQDITIDVVGGAGDGSNTVTFRSTTPSPNGAGVALDGISLVRIDENPNLIVNGSFEDLSGSSGTNGSNDWGYRNTNGTIAGWTDVNGNRIEQHRDTVNGVSARDGSILIDMDGTGSNTRMVQAVAGVETGRTYDLSFSIADFDTTASNDGIRVWWAGQVVFEGLPPSMGWQAVTVHVVGGAGDGTNQVMFEATGTGLNGYGVALDMVALRATVEAPLEGADGDDMLAGTAGHDVLDGGKGDDTLIGGGDADTYRYAAGDGSDTIIERAEATGADVLSFEDISRGDVVFRKHGEDVEVVLADGGVVTLKGQLAGGGVELVTFADGAVLNTAAITGSLTDRAPVAGADTLAAVHDDAPAVIASATLLGNDTDADLDALTVSAVTAGVGGTVALDGDGNVVFTPALGYAGPASFRYTVSDGRGGSAEAEVSLEVDVDIATGQSRVGSIAVAGTTQITVDGGLSTTASGGRAIDAKNALAAGTVLAVSVTGQVTSADDAIRVNKDLASGSIAVDNAGHIEALAGQAIDLANVANASTVITIVNQATGVIMADDADAIRPGANTAVDNYGRIIALSTAEGKSDAIDFQDDGAGVVRNFGGGLISGAHHGISGTRGITVANDVGGTIIGNSGSAVNIDNGTNGDVVTVINHGTMTGTAQPGFADSDGDAIDADGLLNLDNDGVVQGLGAYGYHDGDVNVSEGVAAGGGAIANRAAGVIYGYGRAIQIDDSNNGAALAAVTIVNEGLIQGDGHGPQGVDAADAEAKLLLMAGREAINIVGGFDDSITNSGRIVGGIFTDGGDDVLVNTGIIDGRVDIGDGDDHVTFGAGSIVTGTILLGDGDDTLTAVGATGPLNVDGGAGDDQIAGGDGKDAIHGGLGSDMIAGGGGSDTYSYAFGDGADTITEGAGQDGDSDSLVFTDLGAGAVTLSRNGTDLTIVAGDAGTVTVVGQFAGVAGGGIEHLAFGNVGFDIAGIAIRSGTERSDVLVDTQGSDWINAGGGNDAIYSYGGDDVIEAGAGNDTIYGWGGDKIVYGAAGNDVIFGGAGHSILNGDAGNDIISGGIGNETMAGGAGNDMLGGGGGDDMISGGTGQDYIIGSYGNDVLSGDDGNDTLLGGGGQDTLSGGAGHDSIAGSYGNDQISGGAGNDTLLSGGGNDMVDGGIGQDYIVGSYGNDVLSGDDGNDTVLGGGGQDTLSGGAGHDSIVGSYGNDQISGGAGNDTLTSGGGQDGVSGGDGNDYVIGSYGSSMLHGDGGKDTILGGSGNETIEGGEGNDLLYGGLGSDTFVFGKGDGHDVVGDFQAPAWGHDVVQLDKSVFADFATLISSGHVTDVVGGVDISYDDGSTLTLMGVTRASLGSHDFTFV
jgi:glycerophosphoryl diester phosphodiesterase